MIGNRYCPKCGKELNPSAEICNSCKTKLFQSSHSGQVSIKYGIVALILGIVGIIIVSTFLLQLIVVVVAIMIGGIGLSRDSDKTLATIGILLGIGGLISFVVTTGFLGLYPVM